MPSGTYFVCAVGFVLEVAVGRALAHRTQRTHATVRLVRAALIKFDFAWCFFRTGKHTAEHDAICTCCQSFGNIAGEADTAVGNQGNSCTFQGFGNIVNRSQLRHAHACHDTGRTNRTRADTDFNSIRTGSHQIQSSFSSSNVAADDLDVRIVSFTQRTRSITPWL